MSLTWDTLGEPFAVEFPTDKSATGRHEMYSLFVPAVEVRVSVAGRGVPGRVFPRNVFGTKSSMAFLAFSETWVLR